MLLLIKGYRGYREVVTHGQTDSPSGSGSSFRLKQLSNDNCDMLLNMCMHLNIHY